MKLTKKIIEELKGNLESEKERLIKELEIIGKPTGAPGDYETKFNEIGRDMDENASEVEEYTDNLGVEVNLEKQLKETNNAIERINAGTYGICDNCNQEIDLERLKAYPAATTCIKCK